MQDTDQAVHPDDFGPGLNIRFGVLNRRKVKRAQTPEEVLPVCLAHNLRDGHDDHRNRYPLDPVLKPLNTVLRGGSDLATACELVNNIFDELGIRPTRWDNIMGIEVIVQPPDGHDTPAFWDAVLAWGDAHFEHTISVVIHRDERRPHAHLLALAVMDGKLAGDAMTSGPNRHKRRSDSLGQYLRERFGACMRRQTKRQKKRRPRTLEVLALSTGKGAKTPAAAARRDAELARRTGPSWRSETAPNQAVNVWQGVGVKKGGRGSAHEQINPQPSIPSIAQLSRLAPTALIWSHLPASAATVCNTPLPASPTADSAAPSTALATSLGATTQPPVVSDLAGAGGDPVPAARESRPDTSAASALPDAKPVAIESPARPSAAAPAPAAPMREDVATPVDRAAAEADDDAEGFSRERDADHQASTWDEETGGFVDPPPKYDMGLKRASRLWVAQELARVKRRA